MKKVIFFSHNSHKINEITEIFKGSNINVLKYLKKAALLLKKILKLNQNMVLSI